MKTTILALTTFLGFSLSAHADRVGNGGDFIRFTFLERGEAIIKHLTSTEAGKALAQKYQISTNQMKRVLNIKFITVTDETLVDDNGSIVDAKATIDDIKLAYSPWSTRVYAGQNIDKMTFHEVLRGIGIDDDNWVISKQLPTLTGWRDYFGAPIYKKFRAQFLDSAPINEEWAAEKLNFGKVGPKMQIRYFNCYSVNYLGQDYNGLFTELRLDLDHFGLLHLYSAFTNGNYLSDLSADQPTATFVGRATEAGKVFYARRVEIPGSAVGGLILEQIIDFNPKIKGQQPLPALQNSRYAARTYVSCPAGTLINLEEEAPRN